MRIRAFQGLRPRPEVAAQVASLPYDVVSTAEARALATGNPLSLLRVVRAEIALPEDTDPYSDAVYTQAVTTFNALIDAGHLVREREPCVYSYSQRSGDYEQAGVMAVCHVDDYDTDVIKKHEKTRQQKEDDRTRLTSALSANPGPVFLTYRPRKDIDAAVAAVTAGDPLIAFTAPDGIEHRLWRVPAGNDFAELFDAVEHAYVADGHHRAASAARVARERREANAFHTGEEDYNWFLAVLFPANQLNILPYNRLVRDLNSMTADQFLDALAEICPLEVGAEPSPASPGSVSMYLDGFWYGLTLEDADGADPVSSLDVSKIQDRILEPLLAIDDPRTSERIDFVGGIKGTDELKRAVDAGAYAVALSFHPVTIDQLMDIADAGETMPPKSTWFEPKLRSGLAIHTF